MVSSVLTLYLPKPFSVVCRPLLRSGIRLGKMLKAMLPGSFADLVAVASIVVGLISTRSLLIFGGPFGGTHAGSGKTFFGEHTLLHSIKYAMKTIGFARAKREVNGSAKQK